MAIDDASAEYTRSSAGPVRRIRLRWTDGRFSVRGERRLDRKTIPSSAEMPKTESGLDGFWFEAYTKDEKLVYRRFVHDPTHQHIEVFDEETGQPSMREVTREEVDFEVIVPDEPDLASLRFYGTRINTMELVETARQIGEVAIDSRQQPDKSES